MVSTLLSFSITPVQAFIEASRSLRDLKSGSALLSHLTLTAIEEATAKGGAIVFPAVSSGAVSIPNLFLARFSSRQAAEAADCAGSVQTRWEEIANSVREGLDPALRCLSSDWDQGWDEQITRYWDFQTVLLDVVDVPQVLQALAGAAPATIDLGDEFRAVQLLLSSKKLIRRFPGDNGIGRHKCALMGEWEQMGPAGLVEADKFWKSASEKVLLGHLRLAQRDRLCAPALVKRFCRVSQYMQSVAGDIPDTAAVATEAWWRNASSQTPQRAQAIVESIKALQNKLGATADTERRYLFDDDLSASPVAREAGLVENAIADELAAIKAAVQALRKEIKELGDPPRYYAVLVQDGDEIGQWLSGGKTDVDAAFYQRMTSQLQQYAEKVKQTVNKHHGHLVYAGGDDALALLPLSTALACATELRDDFPAFATDRYGRPPTLSTGLAVVHYKYDLRAALRAARDAEKRAKSEGRNAIGINVVKRSGGPVELTMSWEMLPQLQKLQSLFAAGVSDGWLPRLDEHRPHLQNWYAGRTPCTCLIGQATRGLQLNTAEKTQVASVLQCDSKEAEEKARKHFVWIWEHLWDNTDPAPGTPRDSIEFSERVLDRFLSFGLTASFLDRGRD